MGLKKLLRGMIGGEDAAEEQPGRALDSCLLSCCGRGDLLGWGTCCLVTWCPCAAVGENMRRITGSKRCGLGWGLQHFLLVAALLSVSIVLGVKLEEYRQECSGSLGCSTKERNMRRDSIALLAMGFFLTWVLLILTGMAQRQWLRNICQETRTLLRNRVEEGIWRGPEDMHAMSLEDQFP